MAGPEIKAIAPILTVEDIGPCLKFWVDALGFTLKVTVPEQPPYAFAIVASGEAEVMLQTRASIQEDLGAIGPIGTSVLYISVSALEPVLAALPAAEIAVPRRKTFYGADEIYLKDPAGNVIGFGAPVAEPAG